MTYTVAFDNTYPPGNTAANLISGTFRDKTTMVGERLVDVFGMPDYTSDPLKINYVRVGYGTSTKGGHVEHTNDSGVVKWRSGLDNGAGSITYVIRDLVNNINRLAIDAATGNVSLSNALRIGTNPGAIGAIGIPNNTAITSRNAANTADVSLIYLSGTDVITFDTTIQIASGGNININNGSLSVTGGNITGSGSGLTNLPGANVTGTVANATTAANCSGNAATASLASNSTLLGGIGASGFALLTGATFTGNVSAAGHTISASQFLIV